MRDVIIILTVLSAVAALIASGWAVWHTLRFECLRHASGRPSDAEG